MLQHSARKHSELSPSGSSRWIGCPGSVALERLMPEETTKYAEEGTAAHEVAQVCLSGGHDAAEMVGRTFNGFEITGDMAEHIQIYVTWARDQLRGNIYMIEERVPISITEGFGTADLIVYREEDKTLVVGDLKFGRGVSVEAYENTQGLLYAMGALKRFHNHDIRRVEVTIIQPRSYHPDGPIRVWEIDYEDLLDWKFKFMAAVEATKQPEAPLIAGPHCRFCKAAPVCPQLLDTALQTAMADFTEDGEIIVPDPITLTPKKIAETLKNIKVLKNWINRFEAHAHAQALAGSLPEGFKLVPTRAMRKWINEEVAIAEMRLFGLTKDQIFPELKLRSPSQIEEVIGKNTFKPLAAELVQKVSSGVKLAPLSDPGQSVSADAAAEFGLAEEHNYNIGD